MFWRMQKHTLEQVNGRRVASVRPVKWQVSAFGRGFYRTFYNGFANVENYLLFLQLLESGIERQLQQLPLVEQNPTNRLTFLVRMAKHVYVLKTNAGKDFQTRYQPGYGYKVHEPPPADFPLVYSSEYWPTLQDYHNHKVHVMHQAHIAFLEGLTELLLRSVTSEPDCKNVELPADLQQFLDVMIVNDLPIDADTERFPVDVSVRELAYIQLLIMELIAQDKKVNRRALARLISQRFSTTHSNRPSPNSVYQSFYNVDDRTRANVRALVIQMLNILKG